MLWIYYLIGILFAGAAVATGLLLKRKSPACVNVFFKTVALCIAVLLFVRYMSGRDVISSAAALQPLDGLTSKALVAIALFQVWLAYAAEVLAAMSPFFKVKTIPSTITFFALPVFVLNMAMSGNHITAICGAQAFQAFDWRAMLIAMETGLGLGYCIVYTAINADKVLPRKKQWLYFALSVAGMIIAAMPSYAAQTLFDAAKYAFQPKDLTFYHRIMLYPMAIIPIALYLLLKDKPYDTRRFALLYYALLGLVNFSLHHKFADFFGPNWVTTLPLHLCNTAMYITPLCLCFRWKKLFYFTYFINVLGAFLAMVMPNYGSAGILSTTVWLFYANHYQAFYMPLLAVGLGMFPRPRFKEFKYSLVAFAIYFALMLVINAWFSNYNPSVDYFYLNSNFISDKLGVWAEKTRDFVWQFNIGQLHFQFYPLYQFLFCLVYFAFAFGMWFIYELAYNTVSGWQDIGRRNKKIKADRLALEVKLAGRSTEEPIDMDNTDKLILKNFTKRYGTSDVYAVCNANLEVHGGEIFGFLGPNGAGKSTIIKSIVGIQTITDGAIEVCGYDVRTQSVQAKRQIGFVPDHYALYEGLTAREYINYIADLYDVSVNDRNERMSRMATRFQLTDALDNPIKTFSHGMKQKVTIMAALIHNPKVWILDEPLTGLDPNSIYQVKECMKEHAQAGNIVFFSSHIIDVVERVCDRIAIICKGQIQCVHDVHQLENSGETLEHYYMNIIQNTELQAIPVKSEGKANG